MIIDYIHFEQDKYDVVGKKVMVMVGPTNEDGSLVSHEDLFDRMNRLKKSGIKEIIFPGGNQLIVEHTLDFIKKYKNIESEEPMVE
jgi:2-iminoacetate synthase ThiH